MAKKEQGKKRGWPLADLEAMCVEIFAHNENDYEVTLSGNGVSSGEATAVAWAILDILHGDGRAWQDENQRQIEKRAKELRAEYGDEE